MTNYTVYRISKAGTRKELGVVSFDDDPRSNEVIDTLTACGYLRSANVAVDFGTTDRIGIEDPDCCVVVELLAIRAPAPMASADVLRVAEYLTDNDAALSDADDPCLPWAQLNAEGKARRCAEVRGVLAALGATGFKVVAK